MPRDRKDMSNVVAELCLTRDVLTGTRRPREHLSFSCKNSASLVHNPSFISQSAYMGFWEYGMESKVSTYGDLYSYGILLLEMITCKRPTDGMFKDGMDLHNFVMMALPERVEEICDPLLVQIEESSGTTNPRSNKGNQVPNDQRQRVVECLTSIARIGVACSAAMPRDRKDMSNVVTELCLIRDVLTGTRRPREHLVVECLTSIARIGVACSAAMPRDRKDISNVVTELCLTRDVLTGTKMDANKLENNEEGDLDFLSSLVNCTNLERLDISDNNFGGVLPESLSNLSTRLEVMTLGGNYLSGSIPVDIGNLINLGVLGIGRNLLRGPIPSSISKLSKLYDLSLNHNELSGTIPSSVGNLTSLGRLLLMSNTLEGSIPPSLGECMNLQALQVLGYHGQDRSCLFRRFAERADGYWTCCRRIMPIRSIYLFVTTLLFVMNLSSADPFGNETDRLALLKFKESISADPLGFLNSCNDSFHFCNWYGVTCSRRHQRVAALNLQGSDLRGTISPHIGNLSFLRSSHLNLSDNILEGEIPVNLTYCSELSIISLTSNRLTGNILRHPTFLGKSFINHTTFLGIYNLVGNVPEEIAQLKSLSFFAIRPNNLSGMIPSSLFNISSMNTLSLTDNEFEGIIPPDIGLKMPNLQQIAIGGNEFSGTIPASFSNASQLQILDIAENNFVGQVPASFGDLPDLRWLCLSNNNVGSYSANDLYFITSLTNCSNLEILDMSLNNFGGVLPNSVANLSTQLTKLYLGVNQISGNIPAALENLNNLIVLGMQANLFTGIIPTFFGKFQQLQILALDGNRLSGQIPSSIGNLTQMFQLYLSENKLEGSIPLSIGNCKNLQYMDISDNSLSGDIPPQTHFSYRRLLSKSKQHKYAIGGEPSRQGDIYSYGILVLLMFTGRTEEDRLKKCSKTVSISITSLRWQYLKEQCRSWILLSSPLLKRKRLQQKEGKQTTSMAKLRREKKT
ncbi:hypothetical protein DVH24_022964 [Malus domestica]|uniref:Leucine-rich repeat-containing N-terminal plant-type domain-containing protein n=1 Tax=Malus domestica TaxID=3750 RepID=A0A498KKW5_MALDO|nr:hypothetical protein DVH24_022964 [Malus domestica]